MKIIPENLTLPPRTIFRNGSILDVLTECRIFGSRGVLVCGRSLDKSGTLSAILDSGKADDSICIWRHSGGEPTLNQLEDLLVAARGHGAEWILGIGGGSVMDLAKACAGLLESPLPAENYHNGEPLENSRIPFIAAPATAGTGSEATVVTVLTNTETGVKKSFRHQSHIARLVILDSGLLDGCPASVVAASGMDALTQAIEAYTSNGAAWISDQWALQGVELIANNLERVYAGERGDASSALLLGSYLAGLALSNARLGVVHGLAHPLGSRYHQPHGLVCAVCLPAAIRFNKNAMGKKYDILGEILNGDLLVCIENMIEQLAIKSPFKKLAIKDKDNVIKETLASGSTKANPRTVKAEDVECLLSEIF
ncbi:iron-containing alcohol dehydrogenase [PVC group bacterium]|nr:iron-containing alcohol dehydrogenase [PVC group bacterium]